MYEIDNIFIEWNAVYNWGYVSNMRLTRAPNCKCIDFCCSTQSNVNLYPYMLTYDSTKKMDIKDLFTLTNVM